MEDKSGRAAEVKLSPADKKRFAAIRRSLLQWHKKNRRQFSWRKDIRDPYEVLVCEVMGQQTQASRIEQFLPKFLSRFPTAKSLASAKKSEIIKAWQGLGYNRRALNLQKAAIALDRKPFPKSETELLDLPGVGKYTARAILIFAFNTPLSTVDVNVERVLSRLYRQMPTYDSMLPKKDIYSIANEILPSKNSRQWHEALMDFGATVCRKRNPECDECPLAVYCKSRGKLQLSNSLLQTKEKTYFGHPKRIWRGKVLKIISSSSSTELKIINALQNSFPSEFSIFIRNILGELTSEGFCEKKNNTYRLHQG